MKLNFLRPRRQVARVKAIKCNASGSRYMTWRLVSRNGKNVYKWRAESSRHVHLGLITSSVDVMVTSVVRRY